MSDMYYFGPWSESGHYFTFEDGYSTSRPKLEGVPWTADDLDGALQPGHPEPGDRLQRRTRPRREGEALLHHKDGWTALAFWDCTIDTRSGSSSTYLAKGTFTFDEMVELAKTRFAERWDKMQFEVRLVEGKA